MAGYFAMGPSSKVATPEEQAAAAAEGEPDGS
jgi:hypothetical protein